MATGDDWWESTGVDHLDDLPGVRPPEDRAPAYRYAGDREQEAKTDE